MTIFETQRLIIREFTPEDGDDFFLLQSNPDVMRYIRPPRTRDESDAFLHNKILKEFSQDYKGYWSLADKATGNFLGSFVIMPLTSDTSKTQLGYSLMPQYWGRGYATEASMGGVKYFLERSPLTELYAVTETPNIASQKVLLKCGFNYHGESKENGTELLVYLIKRGSKGSANIL